MQTRIDQLRKDIMERKGSFIGHDQRWELAVALARASKIDGESLQQRKFHIAADHEELSRVQVRARFLLEQVALAGIDIRPHWRLAGEHLPHARSWMPRPEEVNLCDTDTGRQLRALGIGDAEAPVVTHALAIWYARHFTAIGEVDAEYCAGWNRVWDNKQRKTTGVYCASGWMENHSIRDYAKVLRLGFDGIKAEIHALMRDTSLTEPDRPQRDNFWHAALSICEAGALLGRRYAEHAQALALLAPEEDRQRLEQMAEVCARVPAQGARTFFEAVQALWFCHVLTCGEDCINANGIGRLDQILWPYYQADCAAGRLTRDEAVEIMEEFACKLYLEYDVQAITLGGVDCNGHDAVNELSYIILDATAKIDFIRDLSVRVHAGSPEAFIRRAAELIQNGGGVPFLFNDDCFIPALTAQGITLEDARDYAPIGCVELTIPGKANPHAVSGWFNALKCVELALFDGCDPLSGEQVGPHTGVLASMTSFDDFYDAYSRQVRFFAERMVYLCNRGELEQREYGPLPCWSVLTDDCLARGRDITDGGAIYNYHSIAFMGTADTADALAALKCCLFEEASVTAEELLAALRSDFAHDEPLRQRLLHQAPKYGNDHDMVDALAARIDGDFIDLMDTMRSPLQGRYVVHLFSFLYNIPFGKTVGATPDGRHAGEPLAYSLSAHQGRDVTGVSAMLQSLAKLPHARAAGASAAIIDLDPALVAGEKGLTQLQWLIRTAMNIGIGQLQWNVTTRDRLLQAQADPEHYGNLPVRVAGYSQMFKLINRELQDHIIARTKHQR